MDNNSFFRTEFMSREIDCLLRDIHKLEAEILADKRGGLVGWIVRGFKLRKLRNLEAKHEVLWHEWRKDYYGL